MLEIRTFLLLGMLMLASPFAQAGPDSTATDAVLGLKAYAEFKAGNYEQAREIWQGLADRGNTTALINLANLFQQGMGVSEDQRQGLAYVRQAAELGDDRAQYELGLEYEKGVLLARDLQQAGHWLKRSASQDNPDGQFAYAILLATAKGAGVENATDEQIDEALDWLSKARDNGHPDAADYIRVLTNQKSP